MAAATDTSIARAYVEALKSMEKDGHLSASQVSAGFIFPRRLNSPGQKKGHKRGYQVFVKVCAFSEDLLAAKPDTRGLLCEDESGRNQNSQ